MSLSAQNLSHPAVAVTNYSSQPHFSTPNLLPSAPPNDSSTDPSTQAANDSTTSTPQFVPFFTLIEDVHTTHHHHPTVHYIFSDDSTDLITEAALRILDAPLSTTPHHHQHPHTDNEISPDNPTPTALPPPRPGVSHRYILLDLSLPPGDAVLSARAHSLTPDWQVLNVEVSPAPTWDAEPDARGAGGAERRRPLMLRIEGTEGVRGELEGGDGEVGEGGGMAMEGLVGVFERRMVELRRLVEVEVEGGARVGDGAR